MNFLCISRKMLFTYCQRRFLQHTAIPISKATKLQSRKEAGKQKFVDCIRVNVKAGNGGDGGISLSSIAHQEHAGPDGGNGGNGGHVIFKASRHKNSLSHLKVGIFAQNGVSGGKDKLEGQNASHLVVDVPLGTVFRNLNRQIVAELAKEGSMFLAARGGEGGKGNEFFKSAERQTPIVAEKGGNGEQFTFEIELRTMADVGLVGFPNAGKSTFLRAISRARPKVAPYAFTTLTPHIGMVPYSDGVQLAVADIPGIIEDAHKNRGLGINFLRHIERCKCLLYVLDMSQSYAQDQFESLKSELEHYSPGLSQRPHAILANKMDLEGAQENAEKFQSWLKDNEISSKLIQISAQKNQRISQVLSYMRYLSDI